MNSSPPRRFASRCQAMQPTGNDPWQVNYAALQRMRDGIDITLLSVGQESDQATPRYIVDAAIASLHAGDHHYTEPLGTPALRQAIARYQNQEFNSTCEEQHIAVFIGAQNALFAVAQVLLDAQSEAIVLAPHYTTYQPTLACSGAKVITCPLSPDNSFQIDDHQLQQLITPQTRFILLNSPNNPSGVVYDDKTLRALISLCQQHGLWLVVDEVYMALLMPEQRHCAAALSNSDCVISINSLSKSHRMTGWRLGWVMAHSSVIEQLEQLSMCMNYGLPSFVMQAAISALDSGSELGQSIGEQFLRRRHLLQDCLSNVSALSIKDSDGGMYCLLDVSSFVDDAEHIAWRLLDDARVAVLPCGGFGDGFEQLLRVSLCVDDDELQRACQRMAQCFAELPLVNKII